MKRAMGALVVLALIGGAVWIGLTSGRPAPPLRVESVEQLAQMLSAHGFGCGQADRSVPGMPPRDADYGVCEMGGEPASLFVFERTSSAMTDRWRPDFDGGWIVGENWVVTIQDARLAIEAADVLGAEALYDPMLAAGSSSGSRLECPDGDMIQGTSVLIGGRGFLGTPQDAVREALRGIRTTDVLVLGSRREVRIFRDDKLIGTASVFRSQKGGWLVDSSTVCASVGIRH